MHSSRISLFTLATIALLFSAATAFAQAKPAELERAIHSPQAYGSARLSHWMFHVYDAQIWTDAPQWSYEAPFALSIIYSMAFSRQQLVDSTLSEMKHVAVLSTEQEKAFGTHLENVYKDVAGGDRISALYQPPATITFYINGAQTGSVTDKFFAHAFFDIWLSPHTSEPSLRKGLLGIDS